MPSVVRIHLRPRQFAEVAQLIEHQPSKLRVASLSQMGQTVNLLAYAFGGSNPSLPTRKRRKRYDEKPSVLRVESPTGVEVDLSLEKKYCQCSSGVEHFLGKEEVTGSNPVIGSRKIGKI